MYSNLIHWEIVPHAKYSFANETDELIVVRPSYVMLKLHFFLWNTSKYVPGKNQFEILCKMIVTKEGKFCKYYARWSGFDKNKMRLSVKK